MGLSKVIDFGTNLLPFQFSRIPQAEAEAEHQDNIELQLQANTQPDENHVVIPKHSEESSSSTPIGNGPSSIDQYNSESSPGEFSFCEVQPEILVPFLFMGLIMWGMYYALFENDEETSVPPKLYLDSFNVSKFHISNGIFSAVWHVDLTICNPNNVSVHNDITIYAMEAAILYKGKVPLSVSTVVPKALFLPRLRYSSNIAYFPGKDIIVRPNENKTLHLTFRIPSDENELPPLNSMIIEQIVDDWKRGSMEFSMVVSLEAEADLPSNLFLPHLEAYPYWENLEVKFEQGNEADSAKLTGPLPKQNSGANLWSWNGDIYSADPDEYDDDRE